MGSGLRFEDSELQSLVGHLPQSQKHKGNPGAPKKKVLVIAGPTAVGKTKLSLLIAQAIGGEVISADSMQVYRGMDIGTAKASLGERREVVHHLVDSRDLDETFNVVDFYHESSQALREVFAKDKVPIVVGGTGFYIHSLIYGPPSGPPSVLAVRERLEEEIKRIGSKALYERLLHLDPEYARTITSSDQHKIVRALEIIELTGRKVSDLKKPQSDHAEFYDFRCWFLYLPKEILYPRIEMRCDQMIAAGFVDEVKGLAQRGLRQNSSASQAIGYRQCLDYLDSPQTQQDWDRFVFSFKQASRRYAKRQITWFRKEPLFRWLNLDQISPERIAETILQDYELSP